MKRIKFKQKDVLTGNDGDPYVRINSQRGNNFDETLEISKHLRSQIFQDNKIVNLLIKTGINNICGMSSEYNSGLMKIRKIMEKKK